MLSQGKNKSTIRFAIKPEAPAKEVSLAGSFTDWKPVEMARQKNGAFVTSVKLPRGTHQYKFVVDGTWIPDPDNDYRAPNPFGSANSVVSIG